MKAYNEKGKGKEKVNEEDEDEEDEEDEEENSDWRFSKTHQGSKINFRKFVLYPDETNKFFSPSTSSMILKLQFIILIVLKLT